MVAPVLHTQLAPGLDRDPFEGETLYGFCCEQGGVFAHLSVGGAERPLISVAEAVSHDEVAVFPAQSTVVSKHHPSARPNSPGDESIDRFSQGIVDAGPWRVERTEAPAGPHTRPNGAIKGGRLSRNEAVLRVLRRSGPHTVVRPSQGHVAETSR